MHMTTSTKNFIVLETKCFFEVVVYIATTENAPFSPAIDASRQISCALQVQKMRFFAELAALGLGTPFLLKRTNRPLTLGKRDKLCIIYW